MASSAVQASSDGIMVGGSTRAEGGTVDETIRRIKRDTDVPAILFPSNEGESVKRPMRYSS